MTQADRLSCPHCGAIVKRLDDACAGCGAERRTGMTKIEALAGALLGCAAGLFVADAHNADFFLWGAGGLLVGVAAMALLGAGQVRFARLSKRALSRRRQAR